MSMIWVAYCTTCHKELDRAANGPFMEAAAKRHMRNERIIVDGEPITDPHKVLVGYEVDANV